MKALSERQAEVLADITRRVEEKRAALASGRPYRMHRGQLREDEVQMDPRNMVTLRALERRGLVEVRTTVVHWTDTVPDLRRGGFMDRREGVVFATLPAGEEQR